VRCLNIEHTIQIGKVGSLFISHAMLLDVMSPRFSRPKPPALASRIILFHRGFDVTLTSAAAGRESLGTLMALRRSR
jgi:hypothetical protein